MSGYLESLRTTPADGLVGRREFRVSREIRSRAGTDGVGQFMEGLLSTICTILKEEYQKEFTIDLTRNPNGYGDWDEFRVEVRRG